MGQPPVASASRCLYWTYLQLLRNKLNIQLRRSKANFFQNGFEDCVKTKNIKKSWSLINSLTGKKNKFSNITEISTNNSNIVDPAQMAECFNDYFVNIGFKLAAEISNESMDHETYNYIAIFVPR